MPVHKPLRELDLARPTVLRVSRQPATRRDELEGRVGILLGRERMALAFFDDDLDPAAGLLVAFLGLPRLGLKPRIQAAADVEDRRPGPS